MWAWMNLRQTDDIGQSYQTTFLLLTLPYSILCWWCSSIMSGSRILHILFCCFSQSVFFFFFFSDACRTLVAVLVPVRHCVGVSVCGWRSGWMFAWLMNTSLQPLMKMLPVWLFPSYPLSVICVCAQLSLIRLKSLKPLQWDVLKRWGRARGRGHLKGVGGRGVQLREALSDRCWRSCRCC